MPWSKCRPLPLLGRRKLGEAFLESRAAGLCLSREELRYSSRRAAAQDGVRLAKARDAVHRSAVRRPEPDALHRVAGAHRLSAALLRSDGQEKRAARRGSGERLSRSRCHQRQRHSIRAGQSLFPAGGRLLRGRNGSISETIRPKALRTSAVQAALFHFSGCGERRSISFSILTTSVVWFRSCASGSIFW